MISINPQVIQLTKGQTQQLTVTKDFEGEVKFTSTNKNVATVNEEGLVTAVGVSTAYVTASAKGPHGWESASTRIDVPGLMMAPVGNVIEVKLGKNIIFSIVKKHPATMLVQASVSEPEIARIQEVGATSYKLTTLAEGVTSVNFRLVNQIDPLQEPIEIVSYQVAVGNIKSIAFRDKVFECEYGKGDVEIPIIIDPSESDFRMESQNENVFRPGLKNVGTPTGLGSTTVTAKRFDLSDQCTVKVKGIKCELEGTVSTEHSTHISVQCSDKVAPSFKSLTPEILTVDRFGTVTGVNPGEGQIEVTAGNYKQTLDVTVEEFFVPITELTDEIKKTILIFTSTSCLNRHANGREVRSTRILEGLIPIFYIKNNEDPNLFEYELAILDKDLTRYNSLCSCQDGGEPAEETAEVSTIVPEDIKVGQEFEASATVKSESGVNKALVHFEISGPGKATIKLVDSEDHEFTFENSGDWGPAEGFDIPEGSEETTPFKVTVDKEGTYNYKIEVIKAGDRTVVSSSEGTFEAVKVPDPSKDTHFEIEIPEDPKVGVEISANSTFKSDMALSKVRFKFETTGPGKATYKTTDSIGTPSTFENNGYWGPEEGFDVPEGYKATTPVTITFDTAGEYNCVTKLVKAEDDTVLDEVSVKVIVTEVDSEG